jgi:hypothetical protein
MKEVTLLEDFFSFQEKLPEDIHAHFNTLVFKGFKPNLKPPE